MSAAHPCHEPGCINSEHSPDEPCVSANGHAFWAERHIRLDVTANAEAIRFAITALQARTTSVDGYPPLCVACVRYFHGLGPDPSGGSAAIVAYADVETAMAAQ